MRVLVAASLLILFGCQHENVSMPGAYSMLSQRLKGEKFDTTYVQLKQSKIYTDDGHMMYANVRSQDSVSAFGIASYDVNEDTVTEHVIYSAYDTTFNNSPIDYKLRIEKTGIGYKQFIPEIVVEGRPVQLIEEYRSVGISDTTPLKGSWKMTKGYTINGNDTSTFNMTQYKTYYGGQFIWGHTYIDSANKPKTGVGFGTFTMQGPNKIHESAAASTYYQVRGNDFDIDFEMNGDDGFTQTFITPDSARHVEVYQRVK